MAHNINVKTINVEALSDFSKACVEKAELNAQARKDLKPLDEEKDNLMKQRKDALEALENGTSTMTRDEIIAKYNITEVESKIAAIKLKLKDDLKPVVARISNTEKLVNDNIHVAYLAMVRSKNGSNVATGKVELMKKNGEVEVVTLKKGEGFRDLMKDFLSNLGASFLDDEKALNKFATKLVAVAGGVKLDKKNMDLKERNKNEVKDIMLIAVIKILVERGLVTMAEDGSLTRVEA